MMTNSATDIINKKEFKCCKCRERIKPGEKCVMFTSDLKMKATKGLHPGIVMPTKAKKQRNIADEIEVPTEFFYEHSHPNTWFLVWHEHCYIKKELERMTKFIMW